MSQRPAAGKRPVTLKVLAGLLLAKAVVAGALAVGWRLDDGRFISTLGLPNLLASAGNATAVTAVFVVAGVLLALAAIGLLAGRRSGWLLAMVLTGIFIAADIITFGTGTAHHFWMLLNIVTVFYLNQRDVRETFMPPSSGRRELAAAA